MQFLWQQEQDSNLIQSLGGQVMSAVSRETDYVVAGEAAGGKLAKAEALGLKILSEEDFTHLTKAE